MIKHVFLSLALILVVHGALRAQPADTYRVVRVVGHVESSILKRVLKTQDVIPNGDQLKFKNRQDYLIIFNPKSGRKRIQGVPDDHPRELNSLLQSFLRPDERSTGTRGNQEYLEQLKASLQDTVLILGDGVIELDPQYVSLNAPATIKAEYKLDKKNTVVLVSKGNAMYLDRKTLFPSNPTAMPEVLLLYFQSDSSNPLEAEDFLGHFVPLYIDDALLVPEVTTIAESLKGTPAAGVQKHIADYLRNEYGHTQEQNLKSWLTKHKLLPEK